MTKKAEKLNNVDNPKLGISDVRQRLLDRIKEIENGKEEYRTSGKSYSRQGREYWEGGYLIALKELKSLLNVV
jgi:hypothetical protein